MTLSVENNQQKPLTLLIAEDNPVDTRLLESMLKNMAHIVKDLDTAGTVSEALQFIGQKSYDAIILDLNLPDSAGIDTVTQISRIAPELPIVVNTGANEEEMGLKAVAAGAEDFLVKGMYTAYILSKTIYYAIERKRIEAELKSAYTALQEAQEHLIEAEKMKVVGGLATGIAHEVKNPLSTILYGVTYLSDHVKSDNKNFDTVVNNIREATQRADNIIMDLLDFAALKEVETKLVNINDLIDKSLSLISFQFEKKLIKIKKEYTKNLPNISVDSNRIDQVILNVLLNAEHAIDKNGAIVIKTFASTMAEAKNTCGTFDGRNTDNSQAVVIIQIQDDGCGIEADKLKHIFEPFFTTKRAKGGVGLGLSVVKNIMDRHDAFISAKNNDTTGATISLIFKASEDQ